MKIENKIILGSLMMSAMVVAPIVFAENSASTTGTTPTAVVAPTSVPTPLTKEEIKTKMEALRADNKAKREALKGSREAAHTAEKAKREEDKSKKESETLSVMQANFAKKIMAAQAALDAAKVKLTAAGVAAAAATDKASFEIARKMFMDARQMLNRAMNEDMKMSLERLMKKEDGDKMMKQGN